MRQIGANINAVCIGVNHADLPIATVRISLDNLKMKIPIFKPKDQLTNALNTAFVTNQQEAKYYTTTFRTFCLYSRQNNFNGTWARNIFDFGWENISNFTVSVNNVVAGNIKNEVETYHNYEKFLTEIIRKCLYLIKTFCVVTQSLHLI